MSAGTVLVVGGGPAGLAAAAEAAREGARVTLVERDTVLGGILGQCVHDGFGIEMFGEALTGPEYVDRMLDDLEGLDVRFMVDTMVLDLGDGPVARIVGPEGYEVLRPEAVIVATGCREKSFGSLAVSGSRPAGIFTAGTAQRLVNVEGLTVGQRAVILGSGDVGLIMARRLVLEGAQVECVVERMPYPGGLPRNVSQCLNDFQIPLLLEHTVTQVLGRARLEGVVIAEVDSRGEAVAGSERVVACDTLLVSVGLIPENELLGGTSAVLDRASRGPVVDQMLMTLSPGVFSCGNSLQVHDLADWAGREGQTAGRAAAAWARGEQEGCERVPVMACAGLRYVAPQVLLAGLPATLRFRVTEPFRRPCVSVKRDGMVLAELRFDHLAPSELASLEVPGFEVSGGPVEVCVDAPAC